MLDVYAKQLVEPFPQFLVACEIGLGKVTQGTGTNAPIGEKVSQYFELETSGCIRNVDLSA